MKKNGFTILEMLIWLLAIAIFTIIALNLGKKTLATSIKGVTGINDEEIFLDDISLEELSQTLGVPVVPVANDGEELLEKLVGEAL